MPPAPAQPGLQSKTQPARANLLDTLGIRQLLPDNPNTRKYLQIGAVLVVGLAFIGLVSVVMFVGASFRPSHTSDGQKPGAEQKAKTEQEQKTFDATEIPALVQSGKLQKLDGQRITVTGPLAVQPMGLDDKNGNFVMGYLISTSKGITHNNEDNWLSVLFLDKRNNKLSAEFLQLSQRLRPGDLVTVTGNVSYKGGKLALYDAELVPVR